MLTCWQPPALDWREWHKDYDRDSPLARRLEIVQRHIGDFLDHFEGSPIRLISMCSGEGRDILGVLAEHPRRDVRGLLVESDPELARRARLAAGGLGGARDRPFGTGNTG